MLPSGLENIFAPVSGGISPSGGPTDSSTGGASVNIGGSSPVYRAPLLDMSNPLHVGAALLLLVVAGAVWRKMRKR